MPHKHGIFGHGHHHGHHHEHHHGHNSHFHPVIINFGTIKQNF